MTDHPGQRRLARVQVVNWGTFSGYHRFPIARRGFLITGNSGSGKSTLLDAISAVLMPGDRVKFNAAAQEADRSGRSLVSYIRGAWRRDTDAESDTLVSSYLRPDATLSAVALTYRTGDDQHAVTLVKLMHLGRGKNTVGDVSQLHVLLDDELDLTEMLPYLKSGIDTRAVRKHWPSADVNPSYAPFARKFRSRLGISTEGAQRLLHRTLSAKSLGSLDQLFRDFMLDEPGTVALADRAVTQFHDLREAHRVVVDARQQVEMLTPLTALADTRQRSLTVVRETDEEQTHVDAVYATRMLEILRREITELTARSPLLAEAVEAASRDADAADQVLLDARVAVDGIGGGRLAVLTGRRDDQRAAVERIRRRRAQIAAAVSTWDGEVPVSAEEFARLVGQVNSLVADSAGSHEERRAEQYELSSRRSAARLERSRLEADREALARRRSNIDPALLHAREIVCAATGFGEDRLPFGGELLEVMPDHAAWTGPIERVLGGFGRTLLVPDEDYRSVAAAIDANHLDARLVYLRVRPVSESPRRTGRDSLVRKLTVAPGPMAQWLQAHLADSFDYACVESVADFAGQTRAVTRAGQVKHSAQRHEKDDRRRIDDRTRWVLGFDNETKIADLRRRIADLDEQISAWTAQLAAVDADEQSRNNQIRSAQTVLDARWSDIDVDSAQAELDATVDRIARWEHDNPEHSVLSAQLDVAAESARNATASLTAARAKQSAHEDAIAHLQARADEAAGAVDHEVPGPVAARLDARFAAAARRLTSENIDRARTTVDRGIADENKKAQAMLGAAQTEITRILTRYLARWEARGGELRAEAEYVDDALAILSRLRSDGLPRYENRFFELLNDQSARNIGEIARAIRKAPADIRARIEPVNDSLRHSPFDVDRWLKISVREHRSPAATEFLDDLAAVAGGSWTEDDRAAAEQRFVAMSALLERLGSAEPADRRWRRLVLDTRLHVKFIGVEFDADGAAANYHDSSAGLSGGQAQKLVFFCLAAALRYQLAPDGSGVTRYGTVILDEAFDRADAAFTRRALDVFTQFGFHLVLATPLKLLQTLEDYIGGTATIAIRDSRESTINLVEWTDVDEATP
ncbi:ATP-binding protein [Gordonia aichiensis]|uniref:ATP-binding protein n=1 Tax=Gordonia aichiensis TaxID=36820 RepID=UPI00326422E4